MVHFFGENVVLNGVNLSLRAGEITVIRGANGAGKSTLLRVLAGLLRPSRGVVRSTFSNDDASSRKKASIGLLGHSPMLYAECSGYQNLVFFAKMGGADIEEIAALDDQLDLRSFWDRQVHLCSRGQVQRLALARAMLGGPDVLLLDEPLSGLDTENRSRVKSLILAQRELKRALLIISHDADLMSEFGDQCYFLERGKLIDASKRLAN